MDAVLPAATGLSRLEGDGLKAMTCGDGGPLIQL